MEKYKWGRKAPKNKGNKRIKFTETCRNILSIASYWRRQRNTTNILKRIFSVSQILLLSYQSIFRSQI